MDVLYFADDDDEDDDDELFLWYGCGKAFSLISSRDDLSDILTIMDLRQVASRAALNLSSGLVEWSCAVVITTTQRRQISPLKA